MDYFENFDNNFLIVNDIDSFKYFTVFTSTELTNDLIIILITTMKTDINATSLVNLILLTPIQQHAARRRSIR